MVSLNISGNGISGEQEATLKQICAMNSMAAAEEAPAAEEAAVPMNATGAGAARGEASEVACDSYRVDMLAASFGACKCGFAKRDHTTTVAAARAPRAAAAEEVTAEEAPAAEEAAPPMNATGAGAARDEASEVACDSYRVDMLAASFGTCKCGFAKRDHTTTAATARAPRAAEEEEAAPTVAEKAAEVRAKQATKKQGKR